jgi:hypothetical protein
MKKLITGLLSCFAVVLLIVPLAQAQTPDGETPAEETVCDPLKVDGITKGLYGLCVAFCEAQDFADEDFAITTHEELNALEAVAPSAQILANYNKKRDRADNGIDPEMPCIKVHAPCLCWDEDKLAEAIENAAETECIGDGVFFRRLFDRGGTTVQAVHNGADDGRHSCRFRVPNADNRTEPYLTHAEAAACLTSVNAACDN